MNAKLLNDNGQKTYALIFEQGDEVMKELTAFAKKNNMHSAQFSAIGAFQEASLSYFMWDKKEYKSIEVKEQVEVLALNGDIALKEGEPTVHAHIVLGKSDGSTIGGHLSRAIVRPTLEVILIESPAYLKKKFDEKTHLFLIDTKA